jgi:hypothetical protein
VSGALLGHVAPEFGYWIRPDLMLSLQGRMQLVTGPTEVNAGGRIYGPVKAAYAAFARATWLMGDGPVHAGELRPFFAAGLGGGQIRHVVTFSNLKDCGPSQNQTCVDSVVAGPFLVQGGLGVMYKLASTFSLVGAANAELAAPKFTANLDVNLGVAFDF